MKKWIYTWLLLLPLTGLAQTTTTFKGSIEGRTSTGQAYILSGATIYLPDLQRVAISKELGRFELENIPVGWVKVQVSHVGYITEVYWLHITADSLRHLFILKATDVTVDEMVVYGAQQNNARTTPQQIITLSAAAMRESGASTLTDALTRLPGVNQLGTGIGISKPVIRGLYGNRIQTVLMGARFDNQQWQDEHGLGLTDAGIEGAEIIKGPMSLMYGSEAMGGVLQLIEEKPAPVDSVLQDIGFRYFSNTFGLGAEYGIRKSTRNKRWRLRLAADNHADYQDGSNTRVLNTRFGNYVAKGSYGFQRKSWWSDNNVITSFSQFGFVQDSLTIDRKSLDARYARKMDGPMHIVFFTLLTSKNTVLLKNGSYLKATGSVHTNLRMENEGGHKISLNMLLNTYAADVQWIKRLSGNTELTLGTQHTYQTNTNYGSRTIIPDAHFYEGGIFGFIRRDIHWLVLEGGLRFDYKYIHTYQTDLINDPLNINTPGKEILPFANNYTAFNASAGATWVVARNWSLKLLAASGYRPGNLAELSSNGLHEGTMRYEIGDPHLKIEQNISPELSLAYQGQRLSMVVSGFYNRFLHYIYLAPTDEEYLGFNIYRYKQTNATLLGGEAQVEYHALPWLDITAGYGMVEGKADNGSYLPFMPAGKTSAGLIWRIKRGQNPYRSYISIGGTYVQAQNKPAQFETSTPTYFLLNAGAGSTIHLGKHALVLVLSGQNLLNRRYADHLSRLKEYGYYNIGRNITLNIRYQF